MDCSAPLPTGGISLVGVPPRPAAAAVSLALVHSAPCGQISDAFPAQPSPSEGEARPASTAADPKNSGNKGVRNQIRLGTLEPKVSATLIASVSTDGGSPKCSPGCCQDYTPVATFPSRLLVFPGLYPNTPRSLAQHPPSMPDLYIHKSSH